jgi:hypothetical protein
MSDHVTEQETTLVDDTGPDDEMPVEQLPAETDNSERPEDGVQDVSQEPVAPDRPLPGPGGRAPRPDPADALVDAVLRHAASEIGTVEGRNNATEYAAEAGHANSQPWCATFVVAMFRRAGTRLPSESAYTPTMYAGLRREGRAVDDPQRGALGFLHFESLGRIAHVGIVESVRGDGRFVTIEGNTDVKGGRTGGQVMRKVRSPAGWRFAMPPYDSAPAPHPAPPPDLQLQTVTGALSVDGELGPLTVMALQRSLNATGATPALSVDGELGPATSRALQARLNHVQGPVAVDGELGPRSTRALQTYLDRIAGPCGVDGKWGPQTTRCLQAALNAGSF